jgi:Tfp pilus assembly protein PilF
MNICQKCHTLNPDLATHCRRCQAELMPPLVPQHLKEEVSFMLDDEELGRISSLELNLRSSEKNLEELADYLGKQSFNNLHLLMTVEQLLEALDEAGIVNRKVLERKVRQELQGQIFGYEQRQELQQRTTFILDHYQGPNARKFKRCLQLAIPLLYTPAHRRGLRHLHQALRLDPTNPRLLQVLAEIHYIVGEYAASERMLDRLAALRPGNVATGLMRALILLKRGAYPDARKCLESACRKAPDSFAAHFLLGVAHFLNQDFDRSGTVFRKAYRRRALPEVSLLSSMAFCLGSHPERASISSREAAKGERTGSFHHFLSGVIHLRRNQAQEAEVHFRQAIQHNPRWEGVIQKLQGPKAEEAQATESRIFTSRLHREMENLMGLLMTEIQNFEP